MKRLLLASFLLSSMTMNAQNMENALTPRRQGLAVIAALEAKGDQAGLEKAAAEALDNGLTISEAKEALSQLYAYTGFPRSLNALGTLQRVLAARQAAGIQDNPGNDASPLPADYDALKQGMAVQLLPGTIIEIPEGAKHWHGAAADSWMQHLTYHKDVQPGASNEWLEPVTDEQYKRVREDSRSTF